LHEKQEKHRELDDLGPWNIYGAMKLGGPDSMGVIMDGWNVFKKK
jgi:hypothetical protein